MSSSFLRILFSFKNAFNFSFIVSKTFHFAESLLSIKVHNNKSSGIFFLENSNIFLAFFSDLSFSYDQASHFKKSGL
jgi:hypothetical protein